MLMLREYFDISKKEENKDLFKGLYINSLGEEYKKHQNAYPVIFMTLKKAKQDTWEVMYDKLIAIIVDVYNQNDYVKEILKENEVNRYNRIVDKTATIGEYQDAISKMTEYLYRYYNKKDILLIDEYDVPLNRAYLEGFGDKAIYEEIKGNLEAFLNTLLYTGYLTINEIYKKEDNRTYASVRIPNEEVRIILEDMQNQGIKEIWLYSMAFCKKKMFMKKEKLD